MPPAARTGDAIAHGGVLATPPPGAAAVTTVLIGGLPAAVAGSLCECVPHAELGPANVVLPAPGALVLIGGLPAARLGDKTACGAAIVTGAMSVLIGGAP